MTRIRVCGVALIIVGAIACLFLRSDKKSLTAQERQPHLAYMENTEEVAFERWQTNQPRHWRHLMVKK